jgi:NADH-quinone oxidoreductase subunit A
MLRTYAPVLILLALSLAQAVGMVILSNVLSPGKQTRVKASPYESGMVPLGSTRERFSVKFYVVAILFIVFDVETVFLFPWAIRFKQLGWFGAIEMAIFLAILLVGYFYAWKRKVLSWV